VVKKVEYVELKQYEFDEQLSDYGEYSCSLPSGTTIGKKWFYNQDAYRPGQAGAVARAETKMTGAFPDWWQGEFAELVPPIPNRVAIIWRKVRIVPTSKE
jgi:hypothetical protein